MTCGCGADLPSMRSFMPACSISTVPMPRSATLSMSSRISLKFNSATSDQLVAKRVLRLRKLVARAAVIAVRPHHEQQKVLRGDRREQGDVLFGEQRELQNVACIQVGIRQTHRFDEASKFGADDVERHGIGVDAFDGDAVERDQTDRKRPLDAILNRCEHVVKDAATHSAPPASPLSSATAGGPRLSRGCEAWPDSRAAGFLHPRPLPAPRRA